MCQLEVETGEPLAGAVMYSVTDHAFSFVWADPQSVVKRDASRGLVSFAIGTLELVCSLDYQQLLMVWGYSPRRGWRTAMLAFPAPVVDGSVRINVARTLQAGQTEELLPQSKVQIDYDPRSGWVKYSSMVGRTEPVLGVRVNTGTIIFVCAERGMSSLWLLPEQRWPPD